MPATKARKPRASKTKVEWMKRSPRKATDEANRRRAGIPQMGKPRGEYTPMEEFLRAHENGVPDAAKTVKLMDEFQQEHIDKNSRLCVEQQIARVKRGTEVLVMLGCQHCGNVRVKKGTAS